MSVLTDLRHLREEVGDALARHEHTKSLTDYSKYENDPEGFMRDVLKSEPWSKQIEIAEAVRDRSRVVVVSCNGAGKDFLASRLALWWTYARRGYVILTGPGERTVKHILMKHVRRAFASAPELPGDLYAMELRVSDDCGILAFTSDNADRLVGFHHPKLLVIITEGQGVEDSAYEAAQACCTSPSNRILCYGNPTRATGSFARVAQSAAWFNLTIPATSHPNIISGREELPGGISREWVETMRAEYGEASSIYRSRVMALFPTENLEGLIKREWLRAAFDRHENAELMSFARWKAPTLSLDIARYGPDSSVLALVRGAMVEKLTTWRGKSITESVGLVLEHATALQNRHQTSRPRIVVDETGLGGGAVDILREKHWQVMAFNGSNSASQPDRFLNLRAEAHWKFRELLERNAVALPRDPLLEEEALAVEWQVATNGSIQILAKDTIKSTIGRSPDRLDAVVMGLAASMGTLSSRAVSVSTYAIG